ncbi:hypothetical protein Trydic_g13195 [Trypoxylus dichotomus]
MADWDEIKRLAADFQKVQLSSSAQRLSERNCIEIVTWLVQRKMIDLIFTSDGKEYMTPSHLINDIRGELYVNGGRVNLVELAKIIGVDLSHINAHLNEVLKGHKDIHSVLGQLVDATYITKIAGEINEKLQQQGQININDLTLQYDLPADFLQQQVVEKNLGKLIFGKQDRKDPRIVFTESFIARTKAKIRGALIGLTKPTSITVILSHADVSERLFFSLFDQCCPYGTLTNRLAAAQYIPNIYTRSQNEWVNNFYKQNGYLEYDALNRLGISDYKTYLKKLFTNEETIPLDSCVISKNTLDRAEADIDECINSKTYLDLQSNLPSMFNEKDIQMITEIVLNTRKAKETVVIENYILSKAFLETLATACSKKLEENANKVVENGKYQHYQTDLQVSSTKVQKTEDSVEETKFDKREERRKKATGGKSGGGTQGRETKTKSTKKHYRGGKTQVEIEDESPEKKSLLEIISPEEIIDIIQEKLEEEGLDILIDPITNYLYPILNEKGLEIAGNVYALTVSDRTAYRRHTHNELQNKINALVGDVRLFEKGIKLLPSDTQAQLNKYLLKSLCADIVDELLNYIAAEENINTTTENFTHEQRLKFVNDLPQTYKNQFLAIVKTLSGQNVEEFLNSIDEALATCSMILKKIDKKKDRIIVLNHKHSLLEQLDKCDDPALVLHLTSLVLFVSATQNMLHASGRHVSSILSFLKQYLTPEQAEELTSYHDFVTLMLSGGSEAENAKERLKEKIKFSLISDKLFNYNYKQNMSGELAQCYNRGCGQKYEPNKNTDDSCRHHPGEPFFHDAYKGWSCCNKKCTDFTEFLNIKGCTVSKHCNVKPPEPEKPVQNIPDVIEVTEIKPLQQAMTRPPFDTPMTKIEPEIASSVKRDFQSPSETNLDVNSTEIKIGTSCKNGGCRTTYEGASSDTTICTYHPGVPIFHEGLKFWSCCRRRTTDFTVFLNQIGCETGQHIWKKDEDKSKLVKCRWDFHQTGTYVFVSIYAKNYCPSKSVIKLNPIRLYTNLVFPQEADAVFNLDVELNGIIDVGGSQVNMLGTKVEIKMKKAEPHNWSKLEYPKISGGKVKTDSLNANDLVPKVEGVDLEDL